MKKIEFVIKINATKETVWATLWNDNTYRQWTSVFAPGSHAVGDWKQGTEIKFIDDKGDGMFSTIETNLPYEQMSFKHLGELKNDKKVSTDWEGTKENYFLKEQNGITELKVDQDIIDEYEKYFVDTYPKALEIIKQISENNSLNKMDDKIIVTASINADVKKVWEFYTNPKHIVKWNFADPSWHCPIATNDMKVGGKYFARMEAKDKSFGFDFEAIYDEINYEKNFTYSFDNRTVNVVFKKTGHQTEVIVAFDAEKENSIEIQKAGWQAILNNFKVYTESN